jgi:hypothetical protein
MKKVWLAVYIMLLCITSSAQNRTIENLIGVWQAVTEQNESGGLEVVDSTKIYLVYGDEKLPITSYKLDLSKSPGWFDFTINRNSNLVVLKSLILFVNDDLVQWQIFDGDSRPIYFAADKGDMVYLKRKK